MKIQGESGGRWRGSRLGRAPRPRLALEGERFPCFCKVVISMLAMMGVVALITDS